MGHSNVTNFLVSNLVRAFTFFDILSDRFWHPSVSIVAREPLAKDGPQSGAPFAQAR